MLWLFRTHDVKIQIEEARKNNHFNDFENAMKLFIESENPGANAIGLILLIKIKNEDQLYIKEIDLATPNKNLKGVQLQNANLQNANLQGANLVDANFSGANLIDANLSRANFSGAYLTRANLAGANLTGAYLARARFIEANLTGADLNGANLTETNFNGANLIEADLTETILEKPIMGDSMKKTKLKGAKYSAETTDYDNLRPEERGMIKMKLNENDEWVEAE